MKESTKRYINVNNSMTIVQIKNNYLVIKTMDNKCYILYQIQIFLEGEWANYFLYLKEQEVKKNEF